VTAETAPAGLTRQDVFGVLGALGAIVTLVAAVMFYFGWRRSDAQARAMSIDVSLFGFSTEDYVLRSISSLYAPLLVIIGFALLWMWCHVLLTELLRSGWLDDGVRRPTLVTAVRIVFIASVGLAAACVIFTALAGREFAPWPIDPIADVLAPREWIVPLTLATSTLLAAYSAWLLRQLVERDRRGPSAPWITVLPHTLVVATVILAAFWLLEEYATNVGRDLAEDIAAGVDRLPHAVVTSATPLGLEAPGVAEEMVTRSGDTERYRTTGLRLLARSGGKILLIHDDWTAATGTVIVLADTDQLAWEFRR
jgi:hypothetical protein